MILKSKALNVKGWNVETHQGEEECAREKGEGRFLKSSEVEHESSFGWLHSDFECQYGDRASRKGKECQYPDRPRKADAWDHLAKKNRIDNSTCLELALAQTRI